LDELEWRFRNLSEPTSFLLAILSIAVKAIPLYFIISRPLAPFVIPAVITAAVIAVIPHELAHRQMARRYGCFSRFTVSFTGFLTTTVINILPVFGLVFFSGYTLLINILPVFGLVFFSGYTLLSCRFFSTNREIEGKSAAVGPATNLAISILTYILATYILALTTSGLASFFLFYISAFNAVVAFFNLLPFWILDGLKVFRWNIGAWIAMIIAAVAMMIFTGQI
jgi:Zn-dependent protease